MWPEVEIAKKQNRCELILSGREISERIESADGQLDTGIFALVKLNYLNINSTTLSAIPARLSCLRNLQSLVFHSNRLTEINPRPIVALRSLRVLDFSNNQIAALPAEIAQLNELKVLNLSKNLLTELPCFKQALGLTTLNVANNRLTKFPNVCYSELEHVTEIITDHNAIDSIPNEISTLANSLKVLSMRNNQLTEIPDSFVQLQKLKDLNIENNPFSDKRFVRVVEKNQFKLIMDFLRKKSKDLSSTIDPIAGALVEALSLNENSANSRRFKINIHPYSDDVTVQIKTELVKNVRPFILCCILDNFQWSTVEIKKFIQMQTRLHNEPTFCDKRLLATIATHDFQKIEKANSATDLTITYTAKVPQTINLQPLNRAQSMTGSELYKKLKTEADQYRKDKKRNSVSGIHKYLHLLAGKALYPCLVDGKESVISLPPLTNSEKTKITVNTQQIFVEVTSSKSMENCRHVIDGLVRETITILSQYELDGIETSARQPFSVDIRPVRITDSGNQLRTIFPTRNDLETFDNDKFVVVRHQRVAGDQKAAANHN